MSKTYFSGTRNPLSRRLMKIGAGVVLGMVLVNSSAFAQSLQVRPGELQGTVEVKALGTLESRESEEKLDFLKRVGRVLHGYTSTTNLEACGVIIERPGQAEGTEGKWVVPLVTQMSHIACAGVITLPHDGQMTGETIHSHPSLENGRYVVNQADSKFFQGLHGKRVRRGQRMSMNKGPGESFSPTDFAAGPGWLVENGQLLFQSGRSNVIHHGPIDMTADSLMADTLPAPMLPGVPDHLVKVVDLKDMGINTWAGRDAPAIASTPAPGI